MSTNSGIEWTDATWNPVTGCTRASAGCDHCYAVQMTHRLEQMGQVEKYGGLTVLNGKGDRHFNGVVRTHDDALPIPLRWREPRRVFVNSMSDLFHKGVPTEFIVKVLAVAAITPHHTYQILTKRADRLPEVLCDGELGHKVYQQVSRWLDNGSEGILGRQWDRVHDLAGESADGGIHQWVRWRLPLSNVWFGVSVEDQKAADERIPHLLRCPAAVRFLSCEPLLGRLNLFPWLGSCVWKPGGGNATTSGVNWVIVGGESGRDSRPCNVEWIRDVVEQCRVAGVPAFVKQIGRLAFADKGGKGAVENLTPSDPKGGDWDEWPADIRVREMPATTATTGATR